MQYRSILAAFLLSVIVVGSIWSWLGAPVAMPAAPLAPGDKLYCLSYAPFRGNQTPLDLSTHITAAQIDDDLTRLAKITDCVRTYSTDFGLDQIAGIAARHHLKVIQGLWLSSNALKSQDQVTTAIALANKYPDTIQAVVVGNEVLLRGEMSAGDLAQTIRSVKARVPVPVTYADVWEFWLRNPELASAADFITIHILPYWEDDPIDADHAGAHVDSIRQRVAQSFPGKDVLIGEVGWPSAGRMREGALPSPANQAKVIQDVLARAKAGHYRVNVIEAFDQPWKRALEGTVGGHWGLLADDTRDYKFVWGAPVSNRPFWVRQAIGGIVFSALIFAAAFWTCRSNMSATVIAGVAIDATVGGLFLGWTLVDIPLHSWTAGGWIRSCTMAAIAIAAPLLGAVALARSAGVPAFSRLLGPREQRVDDWLSRTLAFVLIAALVMAILHALGLTFDPRYREFPFAPMTMAVVPYAVMSAISPGAGKRGAAELLGAAVLICSVVFIAINETASNWQSLWFCASLILLAVILVRLRGEPG